MQVISGFPCYRKVYILHGYNELLNKAGKGRKKKKKHAKVLALGRVVNHLKIVESCVVRVLGAEEQISA